MDFLVDSGTRRLYKTKLINIDFTNNENPQECSEINKVPYYYLAKKCFVWFCFGEINDANPDEIRAWVYDDPSDFLFETEPDKFQGKRVTNIEEMVTSRHRTMYFLRPYNQNQKKDSFMELEYYAHQIMKLIEEINKFCHFSPKGAASPIQSPTYPTGMEDKLKYPSGSEESFYNFSCQIYMLFVDGHDKLMDYDRSIIRKSEFLEMANSLYDDIRLFRNVFHHENVKEKNKIELGKLFKKVCGKIFLDDPDSRIYFSDRNIKKNCQFF